MTAVSPSESSFTSLVLAKAEFRWLRLEDDLTQIRPCEAIMGITVGLSCESQAYAGTIGIAKIRAHPPVELVTGNQ